MTYDPDTAERLRELLAGEDDLAEQKMFGGLAFLINCTMAVAASVVGGPVVPVDPADAGGWMGQSSSNGSRAGLVTRPSRSAPDAPTGTGSPAEGTDKPMLPCTASGRTG